MPLPARPSVIPALTYRDPGSAFAWLQTAFGFDVEMMIEDENGTLVHGELRCGNGLVMLGGEWHPNTRSPASSGGVWTQTVHVHLEEDVNAHCKRARAAGAVIAAEPADQFYGDRTYRAVDPEGHMWTFGQTLEILTPGEWDQASGLRTTVGGA